MDFSQNWSCKIRDPRENTLLKAFEPDFVVCQRYLILVFVCPNNTMHFLTFIPPIKLLKTCPHFFHYLHYLGLHLSIISNCCIYLFLNLFFHGSHFSVHEYNCISRVSMPLFYVIVVYFVSWREQPGNQYSLISSWVLTVEPPRRVLGQI